MLLGMTKPEPTVIILEEDTDKAAELEALEEREGLAGPDEA